METAALKTTANNEVSRPGGESPRRLECETKGSYTRIIRHPDRGATRAERRAALLLAMEGRAS